MRLTKYLKAAFANRWNLLAFLGSSAFALLTPYPDMVLPLVLAGEVAYLGLLGTHPKFQSYVEAQEHKTTRQDGSQQAQQAIAKIMGALPPKSIERYTALRNCCLELRQIAQEIKGPGGENAPPPLDRLQLAGLDRLLWIFLRLLFTEYSLQRFLNKTGDREIQGEIARLEKRLADLTNEADTAKSQRVRKALEDNLQTCRDRLANLQKARDNYELVQLEIDRLENKIRSLSELAVNRQEPDFITGQVDQVASSMLETERTMNELQFATGLDRVDDEVPELLERRTATESA